MKRILSALLVVASLYCWNVAVAQEQQGKQSKQPLRILYVAASDDFDSMGEYVDVERENDFRQFLEANFESVKVRNDKQFTPAMAKDIDVILVDGNIAKSLTADFRRPMVLLSQYFDALKSVHIHGSKIMPTCLCLEEKLHSVRSDHAIFKGPLPVTPTLFDATDKFTKKKIRAWKVWEPYKYSPQGMGKLMPKAYVKGNVVNGFPILEAEDSEIISGGENSRGDQAAALAREANRFVWGPGASPSHMTEEGRRVFVNTIVYMKQFDGAKQTVWRGQRPRTDASWLYDHMEMIVKRISSVPAEYQEREKKESFDPQIRMLFPPETVKLFDTDIDKYRALYEPNVGYIYVPHDAIWWAIDEDAKSIGVPNNEVRFLDKCIELMGQPGKAATAQKLLERYTGQSLQGAKAWRQWLKSNREKLYFSDANGYRFYSGPALPSPTAKTVEMAIQEMSMAEPLDHAPVSAGAVVVGYAVSEPSEFFVGKDGKTEIKAVYEPGAYRTSKGALVDLVVRMKIAEGWHTYARVPKGATYDLTKIDVELPAGAHWYGEWKMPETHDGAKPGTAEYRGEAIFKRQLYFTSVPKEGRDPGQATKISLRGTLHYQAGNNERHLAAVNIPLDMKVIVTDK